MTFIVAVDFSFFYYMCLGPAMAAGPQYDLQQTVIVNAEGKLRTLRRELAKLHVPDYEIVFAEDRVATRKLTLYPPYRGERRNNRPDKDHLKEHLRANGHRGRFVASEGNEADDVVATLVRLARREENNFCIVFSGDRDLWQLIGPRTSVFNPIKRAFVQQEDVDKSFQVLAEHIPLHKTVFGDAGDCVPNVLPRMQKQLLPIIRQTAVGNFDDFKSRVVEAWPGLTPRCRELYEAGREQLEINWALVKLDPYCRLTWE